MSDAPDDDEWEWINFIRDGYEREKNKYDILWKKNCITRKLEFWCVEREAWVEHDSSRWSPDVLPGVESLANEIVELDRDVAKLQAKAQEKRTQLVALQRRGH